MIKVGIKFCGGCNPRYDRGEYMKNLVAKHKDWDWELADTGTKYDLLVVIGGCTACCATTDIYSYDKMEKHFPGFLEEF